MIKLNFTIWKCDEPSTLVLGSPRTIPPISRRLLCRSHTLIARFEAADMKYGIAAPSAAVTSLAIMIQYHVCCHKTTNSWSWSCHCTVHIFFNPSLSPTRLCDRRRIDEDMHGTVTGPTPRIRWQYVCVCVCVGVCVELWCASVYVGGSRATP